MDEVILTNIDTELKDELKNHINQSIPQDITFKLSNGQIAKMKKSKAIKYYKLTDYMAKLFSKDPSTKVGALFMYPVTMQILSMGYNGMPRGFDESKSERWARPLKYKLIEHAERNAIYNAAQSGTPLKDSICVASMCPCAECARGIIQSGCKMVVTFDINEYSDQEIINRWKPDWDISLMMLEEAGVTVMFLTNEDLNSIDTHNQ
jgi:dCMP deaminase